MCEPPWIGTAPERALCLTEGAAPNILAPNLPTPAPEPDRRPAWLARLSEAFPPGGACEPVQDWAAVSRRLAGATAGEHRIRTAPTRLRALGALAAEVADGWLPLLVVDLTTGEAWRATLWCRGDRAVRW